MEWFTCATKVVDEPCVYLFSKKIVSPFSHKLSESVKPHSWNGVFAR